VLDEGTAVMTGAQQRAVAPFAAFPSSVRLAVIVGQPSRPDPTRSGSECPMALS
jgi:hypothetical protein